jgi:hypothetical protein
MSADMNKKAWLRHCIEVVTRAVVASMRSVHRAHDTIDGNGEFPVGDCLTIPVPAGRKNSPPPSPLELTGEFFIPSQSPCGE